MLALRRFQRFYSTIFPPVYMYSTVQLYRTGFTAQYSRLDIADGEALGGAVPGGAPGWDQEEVQEVLAVHEPGHHHSVITESSPSHKSVITQTSPCHHLVSRGWVESLSQTLPQFCCQHGYNDLMWRLFVDDHSLSQETRITIIVECLGDLHFREIFSKEENKNMVTRRNQSDFEMCEVNDDWFTMN